MAHSQGITLNKIKDEAESDVEIIVIHGIGTDDGFTKTRPWVPDDGGSTIKWFSDPSMLPSCVDNANIWICNWDFDLLLTHELESRSLQEVTLSLLDTLEHHLLQHAGATSEPPRPILFITLCFGGVLLMKTLVSWSRMTSPLIDLKAFSGVIFLATPFSSASFKRMSQWAKPILGSWAMSKEQELGPLLEFFEDTATEFERIVQDFKMLVTAHWHYRALECQLAIFSDGLSGGLQSLEKGPLVNFDAVKESQTGGGTHPILSTLPNSDGGWYDSVRQRVEEFLRNIRTRSSVLSRADEVIRGGYQTKVKVEQLSHELWPIEQCSFSLREMEDVGKSCRDASPREGLPLAERLGAESSAGRPLVELHQLFEDREDQRGDIFKPRRILIHGRAGIGKTTLCKKAVYENMTKKLWTPHFDRILWIPLRNLTHHRDRNDLSDLLVNEFFSQSPDKDDFLEALVKECERNAARRTLFILDGLNEICHGLACHGVKRAFVLKLLNMPNVIVTSRPGVALLSEADPFHLRLEAIGLNLDRIHTYVEVVEPKNADAIKTWIGSNPAVQDLCRVPIQLNALCVGWNQTWTQSQETPTATKLYGEIYTQLKDRGAAEVAQSLQREALSFLEKAAFDGLVNNTPFSGFEVPENIRGAIANIRFVQAANISSLGTGKASFHFLHLIFREYLAACHIVQIWTECAEDAKRVFRKHKYAARFNMVWPFVAGLLDTETHGVEAFFDEMNKEPLDLLGPAHQRLVMRCLKEVPHHVESRKICEGLLTNWLLDCGSIRHVVLDELSEAYLLDLAKMRPSGHFWKSSSARNLSEGVMIDVLRALENRKGLSEDAINEVARLLLDKHVDVRIAAGDALRSIGNLPASTLGTVVKLLGNRKVSVRKAAADALKSSDHSTLSGPITIAMAKWLKAFTTYDSMEALDALRGWPELPKPILDAVTACLNYVLNPNLLWAAVYAIKGMSRQPNADLAYEAVACRLGDTYEHVRWAAVYALKDMTHPPEGGSSTMRKYLRSMRADVKRATIDSLKGQSHLPQSVIEGIVDCLGDRDAVVRRTAVHTLKGLERLPESTIRKIAALLEPEPIQKRNKLIRGFISKLNSRGTLAKRTAALDVLRDRPNLNEHVVKTIAGYIGDGNVDLRWSAVYALKGQQHLPIDMIIGWLSHEDVHVARAAEDVLRGNPDLSKRIFDSISSDLPEDGGPEADASAIDWLKRLKHIPLLPRSTIDRIVAAGSSVAGVREVAADVLKGQPNLSESAISAIAAWLGDNDQNVRWAVVDVLEGIPSLPNSAIQEIVEWVRGNDSKVQRTALHALAGRPKLPPLAVCAIADCISYEDEDLRTVALYALKGRRNLPKAVHTKFVQWLRDGNVDYTILGLDGLKGGPNLQSIAGALKAITDCLRYEEVSGKLFGLGGLRSFGKASPTVNERRIRRAAADALRYQPEHLLSVQVEEIRGWLTGTPGNDANCRRAAVYALEGRPNLPDSTVDAIADCICSNNALLRKAALDALRDRTSLPESTIKKITNWLKPSTVKKDARRWKDGGTVRKPQLLEIRTAALRALQDRSNLCGPVLDTIAECLHDEDTNLRWSAVYALKGQPDLPEPMIARCLDDEHVVDIKWAALDVLKGHHNLRQDTVSAIANCLRNEDDDLERAALEILKSQVNLSASAVEALSFEGLDKQSTLRLIRHDKIRQALQKARKGTFLTH